jgi:hypothetical protein
LEDVEVGVGKGLVEQSIVAVLDYGNIIAYMWGSGTGSPRHTDLQARSGKQHEQHRRSGRLSASARPADVLQ